MGRSVITCEADRLPVIAPDPNRDRLQMARALILFSHSFEGVIVWYERIGCQSKHAERSLGLLMDPDKQIH